MTIDIPNTFIQTNTSTKGPRVIMKLRGAVVEILLQIAPVMYNEYVMNDSGKKVLYVQMLKVFYGMFIASILFYKKFRKDIQEIGFEINPYEICVANKITNGKQHTLVWHIDDVKSSHVDPKVNDEFYK